VRLAQLDHVFVAPAHTHLDVGVAAGRGELKRRGGVPFEDEESWRPARRPSKRPGRQQEVRRSCGRLRLSEEVAECVRQKKLLRRCVRRSCGGVCVRSADARASLASVHNNVIKGRLQTSRA
jgi:hypothetical protein